MWHDGLVFKLECNGITGPLTDFFKCYLTNRQQRVVLNGKESTWKGIEAGVPQGSVLGPLLFLVYINDLSKNILSTMKVFADDSSLFTRVSDVSQSQRLLEQDLKTISAWGHQWKMVFNPDITKQAVEIIFSVKKNKPNHPPLTFNDIPVARENSTKHLGLILDANLSFSEHIREKVSVAMKGVALLKFLSKFVPKDILNMTYKLYVRPHLDYGDIIYHNQRTDMMNIIEKVQYKAALVVTGCWQGTSQDRLYHELGWESLADRRWYRRLCQFYKIINLKTPQYLLNHLPSSRGLTYNLRNSRQFSSHISRTSRFSNSFFPYCISEWDKLGDDIKCLPTLSQFSEKLMLFVRPPNRPMYGNRDIQGIKLLTKLRTEFSDLRGHRFNHNLNCLSPLCKCTLDDEDNLHYFLRCPQHQQYRVSLLSNISSIIGSDITILPSEHLVNLILYGSNVYNDITNNLILSETLHYIRNSARFQVLEVFS